MAIVRLPMFLVQSLVRVLDNVPPFWEHTNLDNLGQLPYVHTHIMSLTRTVAPAKRKFLSILVGSTCGRRLEFSHVSQRFRVRLVARCSGGLSAKAWCVFAYKRAFFREKKSVRNTVSDSLSIYRCQLDIIRFLEASVSRRASIAANLKNPVPSLEALAGAKSIHRGQLDNVGFLEASAGACIHRRQVNNVGFLEAFAAASMHRCQLNVIRFLEASARVVLATERRQRRT